jgi:thymidylate kinase
MPIVCFEGPSAVGKTTMAHLLAHTLGAVVIPEVAMLFSRPVDPSPTWYFERQVERWQQAMTKGQSADLVILDGDPFQPFWYNWAYHYVGWEELDTLVAFYESQIRKGTLSFPDRYLLFTANERALRERRATDTTRQRRGFEYHLGFIQPQQTYFAALQMEQPDRVRTITSTDGEATLRLIPAALERVPPPLTHTSAMDLFHTLIGWLRTHQPSQ